MKIKNSISLAILLTIHTARLLAQADTTFLSLQDCIRLARTNGPLGSIARSAYDVKQSTFSSFAATYLPQLSLRGDVPGYYSSINAITLPDGSSIYT
ncbi:MAG TPA: hypothetical protein VMH23_00660, partial [Bacteroidota bacterium]|nr:hypothetical protein [Bacteroidota bacterium]